MNARRSVAVLVYREGPLEVLLLKRTPEKGGFWQPVTGRLEASDVEDPGVPLERLEGAAACPDLSALQAAAVREIREETGLADVEWLVDLGVETEFTGFDGIWYRERALAARVPRAASAVRSGEHTHLEWLPPGAADSRLAWEENREALRRLLGHVDPK